jgi:hypothetical protein
LGSEGEGRREGEGEEGEGEEGGAVKLRKGGIGDSGYSVWEVMASTES